MKILVTVKRVEDYESKIKVKPDNTWIVTEGVNYRANPFDEIAVEEGLRLRDANAPSEVVAVSIGSGAAQAELRSALAMGADRGILVKHDGFLDSDAVARLLEKVVEKEKPDLVLMGKQAVDVDDNVTGQLLAEYLGWGQATFASKKESLESAGGEGEEAGSAAGRGQALRAGGARGGRRRGDPGAAAARARHRRPAPERAPLREPAQHHEGEEEAHRGAGARGARRRREPQGEGGARGGAAGARPRE